MNATRTLTLAALAATALGGIGCGSGSAGSGKVGAPVAPVTLRLADTNQGAATPAVLNFVRTVKELSHGAVTIKVVTAPNTARDYEVGVVKGTAAGKWDLGWVGARSLDSVGVPEAGALQVPFLIDSYATQRKVLLGPVGRELTKDMSQAGVTGLGILPDHLSYLVTQKPITSLDDLKGQRMRAFGGSRSQVAAYAALGAEPVSLNGTTAAGAGAMQKRKVFGFDTNPLLWSRAAYTGTTYTLGAPIWPRTAALFAAPGRFRSLPKATQELLRKAAARAAETSDSGFAAADAKAVEAVCRLGGSVATLAAPDRYALVQAAAESARAIPAGLAPADLVAQIQSAKGDSAPESAPPVPGGCAPGEAKPVATSAPADPAAVAALRAALKPGSVYRSRSDYDILERVTDATFAKNNSGTFTFRFLSGGRFTSDQKPDKETTTATHVAGTWRLVGDVIHATFRYPQDDALYHERARCQAHDDSIHCRILSDDGGLPSDPRLDFAGLTEPLVRVNQ